MTPFLVANPLFPMSEMETHNSNPVPHLGEPAAEALPLRFSKSSQGEKSFRERTSGDTEDRANGQRHRSSLSASLTRRTTEENVGSDRPILIAKSNTHEGLTMAGRISALAKNPMTEWQGWRNRRAEKFLNKSQDIKASVSPEALKTNLTWLQTGCSCGPTGSCLLEKAARLAKEAREAEEAAIIVAQQIEKRNRNSRQVVSIFGKVHYLIRRKSSKRKSEVKGKGKEVDTAKIEDLDGESHSPREDLSDEEDEETTVTPPLIPWRPEFQYKPPPSCNCILFKSNHEFSDGQIQKMRWFLARVQQGLASPGDWVEDEIQSDGQREAYLWNVLHPLRPQGLISSPMRFLNSNWIIVQLANIESEPSCSPQNLQISNSPPAELPSQPDLPTANLAPVTLEEYIAGSISASQPRFNRLDLKINTSIHGSNPPGHTPNNTPQTTTSHSQSISTLPSEDTPGASVTLNTAKPRSEVIIMQNNPPGNKSI